jgi:hypothetical protein
MNDRNRKLFAFFSQGSLTRTNTTSDAVNTSVLDVLPSEIILEILSHLKLPDLKHFARSSTRFYSMINTQRLEEVDAKYPYTITLQSMRAYIERDREMLKNDQRKLDQYDRTKKRLRALRRPVNDYPQAIVKFYMLYFVLCTYLVMYLYDDMSFVRSRHASTRDWLLQMTPFVALFFLIAFVCPVMAALCIIVVEFELEKKCRNEADDELKQLIKTKKANLDNIISDYNQYHIPSAYNKRQ